MCADKFRVFPTNLAGPYDDQSDWFHFNSHLRYFNAFFYSAVPKPKTRYKQTKAIKWDLLEVVDGEVTEIFRERSSLLVASGETVLSDDQLKEHLRRLLAYIIASTMLPMNPCSCHPTGPDPTRATTRSSDGMTKQRFAL